MSDAPTCDFVVEAARLLHDRHLEDILVFDVRGLSQITDYIIIASGNSDRQIRALGDELEQLAQNYMLPRYGRDVDGPCQWLVIDLVDVIVHLFEPAMRSHYDLEMMWGDAPTIEWRR
ncbi:MAG: ribosome silencing factor [Phycisphaeraceae bacterium]|nr:ribosome silencing factor [Phycisphaeraceae bacterium]